MRVLFLRQFKKSTGMERKCFRRPGLGPPTLYTFLLGVIFITLSSSRILLVKYSANEENKYDYLPTTVNVCSELMKLILCILVSLCIMKKEDHQSKHLRCTSWKEFSSFLKWSIPAFLYFLDNLIVFYVLSYLQPAASELDPVGFPPDSVLVYRRPNCQYQNVTA